MVDRAGDKTSQCRHSCGREKLKSRETDET
jgi:hypothetical protein